MSAKVSECPYPVVSLPLKATASVKTVITVNVRFVECIDVFKDSDLVSSWVLASCQAH